MGKSIRKLSSVTRVGLDLAKNVFQVHAIDANGEIVVARKLARGRLVGFFSELPRCVVAMEACPSAHHWGRQLLALPAHVKPYVRRNKNDAVDAAAICEAAGRTGQRISSASKGRRHDRSRDVLSDLDHGAPSRHDGYMFLFRSRDQPHFAADAPRLSSADARHRQAHAR